MLKDGEVVGGNVSDARYDRQIRLWGKQGQRTLLEANVVAIGATATVCEALKCIILTGMRSVTLVDERPVTRDAVALNYFLVMEDVGAPLAERAVAHLCELNGECAGYAETTLNPADWLRSLVEVVRAATAAVPTTPTVDNNNHKKNEEEEPMEDGSGEQQLLQTRRTCAALDAVSTLLHKAKPIADNGTQEGQVPPRRLPSLLLVSNRYPDWSSISDAVGLVAQTLNIPVVLVESRGLTGYLQTFARNRVITTPHPSADELVEDLRIFEPFPKLKSWFDAHDPSNTEMFSADDPESLNAHSHLPYICILSHAYRRYRAKLLAERQQQHQEVKQPSQTGRNHNSCCSPEGKDEMVLPWPLKRTDFEALKAEVLSMRRRENPPQESFLEAYEKCYARLNRPLVLQPTVAALFEDHRCVEPALALVESARPAGLLMDGDGNEGSDLRYGLHPVADDENALAWFIIGAIRDFYQTSNTTTTTTTVDGSEEGNAQEPRHKVLPLCGHVPDFTTLTPWFQDLRLLYQAKHQADVRRVRETAEALLAAEEVEGGCALSSAQQLRAIPTGGKRPRENSSGASSGTASIHHRLQTLMQSLRQRTRAEDLEALTKDIVTNIWHTCAVSFSPGFMVDTAEETQPHQSKAITSSALTHGAWRRTLRRQVDKALAAFAAVQSSYGQDCKRACGVGLALLAAHEMARTGEGEGIVGSCSDDGTIFHFLKALAVSVPDKVEDEEDEKGGQTTAATTTMTSWAALSPADEALLKKTCWEVERVGLSEVPFVAATLGAVAAQEVIKLIQRRRVPITYPMVYSGIDGICFNLPA